MNPNWLGIIAVLLAFVAFSLVHRLSKSLPTRKRIFFSLVAVVAAIPGASFAVYYAHLFPEPNWYYQLRSVPGTELLIVLLGVAGGLVATLLPRLLMVLPLLGVAAFSIPPFIKPFIGPIPAGTLKEKWSDGVCLQSTPSTCGPASTATILKQLGVDVTEAELAAEAHSYTGGTEAWYLARAARSRGFEVEFRTGDAFTPELGIPAVVGVRLGSVGHFIAVLGQEGEKFVAGDPMNGRRLLSREELLRRYVFTGFSMGIRNSGEASE